MFNTFYLINIQVIADLVILLLEIMFSESIIKNSRNGEVTKKPTTSC